MHGHLVLHLRCEVLGLCLGSVTAEGVKLTAVETEEDGVAVCSLFKISSSLYPRYVLIIAAAAWNCKLVERGGTRTQSLLLRS